MKISNVNGSIVFVFLDFCDVRVKVSCVNGVIIFEGIDLENLVIGMGEFEVKVSMVNGNIVVRRI